MRLYLIVVLVCISLIASNVEHLFTFVGHLYIFLEEVSLQVLWPCFDWIDFFVVVVLIELYEFFVYFLY